MRIAILLGILLVQLATSLCEFQGRCQASGVDGTDLSFSPYGSIDAPTPTDSPFLQPAEGSWSIWDSRSFSGSPLAAQVFDEGLGSTAALQEPTGAYDLAPGTSLGIHLGGFDAGGYVTSDTSSALPNAFLTGLDWGTGSLYWGDSQAISSCRVGGIDRTLQGVQLQTLSGKGRISLLGGIARVTIQRVTMAGLGSRGPYSLGNTAPILIGTEVVRVNGERIPPSEYSLDPDSGLLRFESLTVDELSVIEVEFEQALSPGDASQQCLSASYRIEPSTGNLLQASISSTQADTGPTTPVTSEWTDGPFYGTGAPMLLQISRSGILEITGVTVDGTPLQTPRDYVAFPEARLVAIQRAVPRGALVLVHLRRQTIPTTAISRLTAGIDGISAPKRDVRLGYTIASSQDGNDFSGSSALRTASGRLITAVRVSSATGQTSLPGLSIPRRESGQNAAIEWKPSDDFNLLAGWRNATLSAYQPYLDASNTVAGPLLHAQGITLTGAFQSHGPGQLQAQVLQANVSGRTLGRQQITGKFAEHGWSVGGSLFHARASNSPEIWQSMGISTGHDQQESSGINLNASVRARSWLVVKLNAEQQRTSGVGWSALAPSARVQITATPRTGIVISAGGRWDQSPGVDEATQAGREALAMASLDDFDPAALFQKQTDPGSASPLLPGTVNPGLFLPTVGMHFARAINSAPIIPGICSSRDLNASISWQAAPWTSLSLTNDSYWSINEQLPEQEWDNTTLSAHFQSTVAATGQPVNEAVLSIGQLQSAYQTGNSISANGLTGELKLRSSALRHWEFEGDVARSASQAWGDSGAVTLDQGQAALSSSLYAARSIPGGHALFVQFQTTGCTGSTGYYYQTLSTGITFRLPIALGLQLKAQSIHFSSHLNPDLSYNATLISLGIVSGGLP